MKVNGKDDIPYMMENYIQVWNHQPAIEIVDKNMDLPSYNMVIFQSIHGNTHGKKNKKTDPTIRSMEPYVTKLLFMVVDFLQKLFCNER